MATDNLSIEEQAIAWTIRARDADFDGWDALTLWLEADELHHAAFQRLAMLDDMLPDLLPSKPVDPWRKADSTPARRWSFARLGAVAAALLAVITLSFFSLQSSQYSVETGPGERRTIALADGSRIDLNGDTKLTLSKDDPRNAVVGRGEALFTVVHNDREPFVVRVGDAIVQDAGTVFNIVRAGGETEVGVSEGLVIFNPAKEKVALRPGYALRATDGRKDTETFAIPITAVGSWQRNQLTYNGASMNRIAADLGRSLGENVMASSEVKSMRFTGTINLKKDVGQFFRETAPVLGVGVKRTKDGWILVGGDEAI